MKDFFRGRTIWKKFALRLGNIQHWTAALGNQLQLADDIAPAVADAYLRALQETLDRWPSPKLVPAIELEHTRTRLGNESVDDILTTAIELPAEDSLAELRRPTYRHSVEAWARLAGSNCLRLADAPQLWSRSARTLAEVDQRLQLQRRILELLAEESKTLAERREAITETLEATEAEYVRLHRQLKPKGRWAKVCGAFGSAAAREKGWIAAAYEIRSAVDQLEEIAAEQLLVDRITQLISAECKYLEARLGQIVKHLNRAQKLGDRLPAVVPFPLDERLASLWDAANQSDAEFDIVIRGSVQFASLAGLAKVTPAGAGADQGLAGRGTRNRSAAQPDARGDRLRAEPVGGADHLHHAGLPVHRQQRQ